jgi:tRNA-Thr(GGU) m(6)t(6)A37 methyltransferase TsaA
MQISLEPIGYVHSERAEPIDDHWSGVRAFIELTAGYPSEALAGLEDFSHVEILYVFHLVDPRQVVTAAEHPRENPAWPKVGIFAQRKKNRPNRLGATIARVLKVEGRRLYLRPLDAVDGTPVVDIKPVFREYLPQGEVTQPQWATELMKDYWE